LTLQIPNLNFPMRVCSVLPIRVHGWRSKVVLDPPRHVHGKWAALVDGHLDDAPFLAFHRTVPPKPDKGLQVWIRSWRSLVHRLARRCGQSEVGDGVVLLSRLRDRALLTLLPALAYPALLCPALPCSALRCALLCLLSCSSMYQNRRLSGPAIPLRAQTPSTYSKPHHSSY
jgi:hypothetical protein